MKPEQQSLARELGAAWVGWTTLRPPGKFHDLIIFALAGELVPPALRASEGGGTLALNGIRMTQIPSLDYDHEVFGERFVCSVTANTRQNGLDLQREVGAIPINPTRFDLPLKGQPGPAKVESRTLLRS